MMNNRKLTFLFALIYLGITSCDPVERKENNEQTIHSNTLNHEVKYLQHSVGDLNNKGSVNLLVLLDGDEYFGFASDILNLYESDEKINPTIVIGLSSSIESRWKYYTPTNATASENSDDETKELFKISGEFNNYSEFVEKEIIQTLEKELNLEFRNKVIFGHSMGGLGALSFMVHKPHIFNNYILASPSVLWDEYTILEKLEKETESEEVKYEFKNLILSSAEDDMANYTDGVKYLMEFMEVLSDSTKSNISNKVYDKETHMTVGLKSLYDGIIKTMVNDRLD